MDKSQKSVTTQSGTPISKHKDEDSPVSKYMNSLSPLKTLNSYNSPSSASPVASPIASSFNETDTRWIEEKEKKALLETEPPQSLKDNCKTPEVINGVGDNGCCEDGGIDLLKMLESNIKAKSETPDWDTLLPATIELVYDSPNESETFSCLLNKPSNSEGRFCGGTLPTSEPVSNTSVANHEHESFDAPLILHRDVRRRCLDFENPGNNQQPLGEFSSRFLVPSTGPHLNTIAMSTKDNYVGNEYSFSGNLKVGLQGSTTPLLRLQQVIPKSVENVPVSSVLEELNPISLKKKRRKSEQSEEGESSCKRCNCKRSKCLKLYCECFAAGVYCTEPCSCIDCFNKPIHEDTVLATRQQIESRNPLAFAPKVIRNSDSITEVSEDASKTPASARHKRGCNCKKSNCLKRYCECYQGGVGCSINCRCEACKNTYGRKDGSAGDQDKENEPYGINGILKTQQNVELFNLAATLPTPRPLRQPLAQYPLSSNNGLFPLRSHLHHGTSGSSYSFRNPDMSMLPHSRMETITEDSDDENIIQSPMTIINAKISPNSKRVCLTHVGSSEMTPWRGNGGRKLILSTPTFPSLPPHQ